VYGKEDNAAVVTMVPLSLFGEKALYPVGESPADNPQQFSPYPKLPFGLSTQ